MQRTFTVQAKAVEKIMNAAAAQGVPPGHLYDAVKLDPSVLLDPDNRIPFAQLVALYEMAARLTGDDNFGLHLGQSINPTAFDVVGYCALNSPTLGEAFTRVARYHSIWTDGALFTLETANDTSAVVYSYVDTSLHEHRQDAEITLAIVTTLCRNIASPDFAPTFVEFQHDAPREISEHLKLFRCPVEFRAPSNKLSFATSFLSLPIAKADARLCALLDRHAEELLAKFPPRDSVVDQVRSIIMSELRGGDPSLERVADALSLTPRTLQRKLQELGTSHNELLDQMRRQMAMRYLREREMAICEVAYLLGFSESSSFHRAFKRWTGVTPKEFRNQK
ncbi:MAG TPA: AraC family transcriptional regulator [Pyrinomonadaceae bacterium]|nr:AraC family transcriptional regulator [Pyrinomonadaceae bacterium]